VVKRSENVDVPNDVSDEQARLWNGPSGHAWVENQELLDHLYKPLEELLVTIASAKPRQAVLDVGCGAGATTIAIARRIAGTVGGATEVAPYERHADSAPTCVGVDISEPLVAAARARAERERAPATFICANAQTYAFEPATFDLIVSRFGIMFFDDPIAAFANLRRATRAGGELRVIPWRNAAENPFMTTAERAAAPLLPNLPPRRPNAPGQFALADAGRMHGILDASGWSDIDISALDVTCTIPATALERHVTRLGPVGLALQEADAATRVRVTEAVLAAFEPFVHADEVRFTAACWLVSGIA
jgi:ubiquinone/menaquinone biosynthesis C-methylase UbiE